MYRSAWPWAYRSSAFTVKVALAPVVLETPSPVVTPPIGIVLTWAPGVDDVTVTVTVHAPPGAKEPPLRDTLVLVDGADDPAGAIGIRDHGGRIRDIHRVGIHEGDVGEGRPARVVERDDEQRGPLRPESSKGRRPWPRSEVRYVTVSECGVGGDSASVGRGRVGDGQGGHVSGRDGVSSGAGDALPRVQEGVEITDGVRPPDAIRPSPCRRRSRPGLPGVRSRCSSPGSCSPGHSRPP